MSRRFVRAFFISFLLLTFCFVGVVAVVDPYYRYHAPVAGLPLRLVDGRHQNPGLARNFPYDTLLVGTSVTANFDPAVLDEALGCQTQKLIVLGGFLSDFDATLEVAFQDRPIRQVFWGMDSNIMVRSEEEKTDQLPDYLYHLSPLGDLSYLLNKEMLFWDVTDVARLALRGEDEARLGGFAWGEDWQWNWDGALLNYERPEIVEEPLEPEAFLGNVRDNWDVALTYIEGYPETQFTIYLAPYSILFWDKMVRSGQLEATLTAHQWFLEEACALPNVEIFYFMDDWEIITDLNNYCDYIHYSPAICKALEERMVQGSGIRPGEAEGRISAFREALRAYPFQLLFPEEAVPAEE